MDFRKIKRISIKAFHKIVRILWCLMQKHQGNPLCHCQDCTNNTFLSKDIEVLCRNKSSGASVSWGRWGQCICAGEDTSALFPPRVQPGLLS